MIEQKLCHIIELLEKLLSVTEKKSAKKIKILRDNLSPTDCGHTEKVGTFCPRDWVKSPRCIGVRVDYEFVPQNLEDARIFLSHSLSKKFILKAMCEMMKHPENHNFWFASKRHYTHVGNRKWEMIRAPVFFEQLKAKIWRFYYRTLSSFFSLNSCRGHVSDFIYQGQRSTRLHFTNSYLMEVLEPYKPVLEAAFQNRVRSRVKVI